MSSQFKQILLFLGDLCCLYLALFLALIIRFQQFTQITTWNLHWPIFSFVFWVWMIVFYLHSLYDLQRTKNNFTFFQSFLISLGINLLLAIGFFYISNLPNMSPKTILLILTGVFIPIFVFWRLFSHWLFRTTALRSCLIFLGLTEEALELMTTFINNPQIGYETSLVVAEISNPFLKKLPTNIEIKNDYAVLLEYLKNNKIETIIVADKQLENTKEKLLYEILLQRINIINLDTFFEDITHRVPLSSLSEGWFLNNLSRSQKKAYQIIKRFLDILLAAIMGIFFVIFFIPLGLLIFLSDKHSIFYKQKRVGRDGELFNIYKFRTMIVDAESQGPQFTQEKDARITGVGKILRLFRLDELPQALNILRNEMSFIGPRPERPEFVAELQKMMPYYSVRHLIKPGLTGWAQVNYNYTDSLEGNLIKLQYDLFYIKNQSILVDLITLLKTINAIVGRKGR